MGTSGVHPGVHNFRREKQLGTLRNWNIVNSAKANKEQIHIIIDTLDQLPVYLETKLL